MTVSKSSFIPTSIPANELAEALAKAPRPERFPRPAKVPKTADEIQVIQPVSKTPSAPLLKTNVSLPVSSKMIVGLGGGLGNQLFAYAFGISVALARNEDVGFTCWRVLGHHSRSYLLDALVTDINLVPKHMETEPHFSDDNMSFKFLPEVYTTPLKTFFGCWQTEKYFNTDLVRQKIAFQYPLSDQSQKVAEAITKADKASMFLHIRRGDYLSRLNHHGLMTPRYYNEAIERVRENCEGVKIFVFSDDPDWTRINFVGPDFTIVDHNKAGTKAVSEDMHLMSLCRNGAIANSSFSWWGAWLGDTQSNRFIFAPKQWFVITTVESKDIVPRRWIKLES